jgi:hypothetical protein
MFTGVGTIITAWAAVVRSKKETRTEEEINCLERLRQSRRDEAESADELYAMRKQRREE